MLNENETRPTPIRSVEDIDAVFIFPDVISVLKYDESSKALLLLVRPFCTDLVNESPLSIVEKFIRSNDVDKFERGYGQGESTVEEFQEKLKERSIVPNTFIRKGLLFKENVLQLEKTGNSSNYTKISVKYKRLESILDGKPEQEYKFVLCKGRDFDFFKIVLNIEDETELASLLLKAEVTYGI